MCKEENSQSHDQKTLSLYVVPVLSKYELGKKFHNVRLEDSQSFWRARAFWSCTRKKYPNVIVGRLFHFLMCQRLVSVRRVKKKQREDFSFSFYFSFSILFFSLSFSFFSFFSSLLLFLSFCILSFLSFFFLSLFPLSSYMTDYLGLLFTAHLCRLLLPAPSLSSLPILCHQTWCKNLDTYFHHVGFNPPFAPDS